MRVQPGCLEVPAVHDPRITAPSSIKRWSVGTIRRVARDCLGECGHVGAHADTDLEGGVVQLVSSFNLDNPLVVAVLMQPMTLVF